jgi:CheY-like chemotaxis protein
MRSWLASLPKCGEDLPPPGVSRSLLVDHIPKFLDAEAMSELEKDTPHVIISDIGMPENDGYSLIRSVRTLPAETKRNIPAIALTAFARNEDRTRALVEGFNVHMAKPVEPTALVQAAIDLAGRARR